MSTIRCAIYFQIGLHLLLLQYVQNWFHVFWSTGLVGHLSTGQHWWSCQTCHCILLIKYFFCEFRDYFSCYFTHFRFFWDYSHHLDMLLLLWLDILISQIWDNVLNSSIASVWCAESLLWWINISKIKDSTPIKLFILAKRTHCKIRLLPEHTLKKGQKRQFNGSAVVVLFIL